MSNSQLDQDLDVLNFYNNKDGGYFVEVGAFDGLAYSNTYLLEKKNNWKGICVEPLPEQFALLKQNRPNSICIDKAIYSESGKIVPFFIDHGYDMLSGISEHINNNNNFINGTNRSIIDIETLSLNDLLSQNNAPSFIEYLSLDTEGSEYEILKTTDYEKYTFGIIHVEHNSIEPKRQNIKDHLLANGYIYDRENRWDDCYKHSSVFKKE